MTLLKVLSILLILGALFGFITGVAKIIKWIYSLFDKNKRRTRRQIQNRPGNTIHNHPHENEESKNNNQFPKYFE